MFTRIAWTILLYDANSVEVQKWPESKPNLTEPIPLRPGIRGNLMLHAWLDHLSITTSVGESTFGERTFGESTFGERTFGESTFGERTFGESTFGERTFGESTFGERTFGESTFGERTFGESTFGERTFGESTFGERTFGESTVYRSAYPDSLSTSSGFHILLLGVFSIRRKVLFQHLRPRKISLIN